MGSRWCTACATSQYVPAALIAYERLRRERVERCADPPMYFRSTTAVRFPSLAIVQAIILPAVTLPTTGTANCSPVFM